MVEVLAVASGKGGTGKTTATMALGMALAAEYDVTVVDADTGMANLLFHAGLADVETTLHDVLAGDTTIDAAVYERFGLQVVPCGTSLAGFREADPSAMREVVGRLAAQSDVILLDSPAALGSRAAVLPIVLADRIIVVLQPTIPSLSDGFKVQEYARAYETGIAGLVFNRVRDETAIDRIAEMAGRYFEGPTLATVPESDHARRARRAGEPLLAHAPESTAAAVFRNIASLIDVHTGGSENVGERFRQAVIPDSP